MMKNVKLKIAFAIIVILVGIGVLITLWVFRKAPEDVSSQKAEFETEVSAIVNAFMEDEQAANNKFLGKVILVKGIVSSVEESPANSKISVTLKDKNHDAGVICEFSAGSTDLSIFELGENITVKGYCTGFLMDVVLNKCVVE